MDEYNRISGKLIKEAYMPDIIKETITTSENNKDSTTEQPKKKTSNQLSDGWLFYLFHFWSASYSTCFPIHIQIIRRKSFKQFRRFYL